MGELRSQSWESAPAKVGVSEAEILSQLDWKAYYRLQEKPEPNQERVLQDLEDDKLVLRMGGAWSISNLGAVLLANDLKWFGHRLQRKGCRLIAYSRSGRDSEVHRRRDFDQGYAVVFEEIIRQVIITLPDHEEFSPALRTTLPLIPEAAVREVVANALIHQDMAVTGSGPLVEVFPARLEVTNPGKPLVPTNRMIDSPPQSRNDLLSALMRRMKICEEAGMGVDKVISAIEQRRLPPPDFRDQINHSMMVVLHGPKKFAQMEKSERVLACYHHAVLKYLAGERLRNKTLCERFGIERKNAMQASQVIKQAREKGLIKPADEESPRRGYVPWWAKP